MKKNITHKNNMKHQNFDGYEMYTRKTHDTFSNDWIFSFFVITGSLVAIMLLAGVENVFNVMAQFIGGIVK